MDAAAARPSRDAAAFDPGVGTARPPSDGLPGDDRPHASQPELVGVLAGPGAAHSQGNLAFYGTDLGLTYEHDGKLVILFGDTWLSPTFICDEPNPVSDDSIGTLPLTYDGGVPSVSFITQADAPNQISRMQLMRGSETLTTGSAKVPMTGFSDGEHEFAIFARYAPTRCDPGSEPGAGICPVDDGFQCSARVGECQPLYNGALFQCDAQTLAGCVVGQSCMQADPPFCFDVGSSQNDGSLLGEVAALSQDNEIGLRRDNDSTIYDSVLSWPSNKFSNMTARTVKSFTGKQSGNDFAPGYGALLAWGRPGFTAEQGRQAQLYLMTHPLPLALDDKNALQWKPQYFAGLDPTSGEPTWSERQSDAKPLALDGSVGGDPHEPTAVVDQMTVSFLPAPIEKWVMLYGGDISDLLLLDPAAARSGAAPGAIMLRFADQPWGPWSPPEPHLWPGNPAHVGDAYGPGGILYNPACKAQGSAACAPSDPLRPGDALLPGCPLSNSDADPGRFYGVSIIDSYTRKNGDDGLDLFWNVSTWNPYSVALMKTTVRSAKGPQQEDELADEQSLLRMSDFRNEPLLPATFSKYRQETSKDRGTSDTSFPLTNNGNRDFNNFICASKDATYDPTQIAAFKFDASSCKDDYARGVVIGRFEGSGRLVRVWLGMYSLLNGIADDEILRIYVDDDQTPKLEVPLVDALNGKAGEVFAPPFGPASPRRMGWYYPVAFHKKLIVTIDRLGAFDEYYYHCDVVLDPVASSDPLPRERLHERDHVIAQLNAVDQPVEGIASLGGPASIQLDPGASQSLHRDGPATIYELRLSAAPADLSALANIDVSVRWDGAKDAAITLGLLDLFGADEMPPERPSLALRSYLDNGKRVLSLRLPMPFARGADFTFKNNGQSALGFELELFGEQHVPKTTFGHLHTQRHETLGPTSASEHLAVEAKGRGRLVGVCTSVAGHPDPNGGIQADPLNLLEADVRAMVDGELALDGTGSEEYADDVFYFTDAPQANAFVQAWGRVDDTSRTPPGQASFCRWHVLGTELDFGSSLALTFELGGAGNPGVVDRVHTVAYLYLPD